MTTVTSPEIAFYSPLKPADHPTPSGDRLMARQLIHCMGLAGFEVNIASSLRAFIKDPYDKAHFRDLQLQADAEVQRLRELWQREGVPKLWFCYHPYYKSPDLIGARLCQEFGIPYISAEASYSTRRTSGVWGGMQALVLESVERAAVNICFTERDKLGLQEHAPHAQLTILKPFIDAQAFSGEAVKPDVPNLVAVAMMRAGDKMDSYQWLAAALSQLLHLPWTLSLVGDGKERDAVYALFADIPSDRISWHGQLNREEIAALFARSSLYLWPGTGEAYGLAYLEAQAAALPVIAFDTAGVPSVVDSGFSGVLTPPNDVEAYVRAISNLLVREDERALMSNNARLHVQKQHTLLAASEALKEWLHESIT